MKTGPLDRRTAYTVVAATVLILLAALLSAALNAYSTLYDDAYIYLRYARNIAAGCGPTFNCGTGPVEGFSSPLYQAILSAGHLMTDDGETLATALGLLGGWLALSATALLPVYLREEWGRRWVLPVLIGCAGVVLAVDSFLVLQMFTGMETWLAWLATAALTHAALARRHGLLAAATVGATLVRPEFGAFLPMLLLFPEFRRVRPWLGIMAALGLIAGGRWLLFGEVLPNTFFVKSGGSLDHAVAGLDYLVGTFARYPLILLSPLALLASTRRRAIGFLLAGSAVWFGYQLRSGGDFYGHSRMLMPLIPALTVLGLAGAYGAGRAALERTALGARHALAAPLAVTILFGAYVAVTPGRLVHYTPDEGTRIAIWKEAGRWLADKLPQDAAVATVSIGAISYYSDLPVIDLIGLTDPKIGREGERVDESYDYRPIGHETFHTEEVLARRPAAIVLLQPRRASFGERRSVSVGMPAEAELLEAIKKRRAPYVVATPRLEGEGRMAILLREDIAEAARIEPTWPVETLEVNYLTPPDPYPWLPSSLEP